MKKPWICSCLLAAVLLGLGACGAEEPAYLEAERAWPEAEAKYETDEAVWMESLYTVYPAGTQTVYMRWRNEGGETLTGGEPFWLEKEVDGVWRTVTGNEQNVEFYMVGYGLPPGSAYWQAYSTSLYLERLTPGNYRISADVIVDYPEKIQVYGYFSVSGDGEVVKNPNLAALEAGTIETVLPECGLVLTLPESWAGFTLLWEEEIGIPEEDAFCAAIDPDYRVLRIAPPGYGAGCSGVQTLAYAVFSVYAWNQKPDWAVLLPDLDSPDSADFDWLNAHYGDRVSGGEDLYMRIDAVLDPALPFYAEIAPYLTADKGVFTGIR